METHKKPYTPSILVKMDKNMKKRLDAQVARFNMTQSSFIRMAIIKELERCEETQQN